MGKLFKDEHIHMYIFLGNTKPFDVLNCQKRVRDKELNLF